MDDICAAFNSCVNDELTEEEKLIYRASIGGIGNIAHQFPLKPGFWDKMEDISIRGASLYSFGIDPSVFQQWEEDPTGLDLEELLPPDYQERLAIIKSAVRAGSIERVPINGSDPGEVDDHTRILKASFLEWCKNRPGTCTPAEKIATYPQYQPKDESEETGEADQASREPEESTHDPLPLDGIACMFLVDSVPEKNIQQWKDFAHDAKRNGLMFARTLRGKGKAQSLFDPVKVGEWLVSKGKMSQEKVERILRNNLPPRNAYLKDHQLG